MFRLHQLLIASALVAACGGPAPEAAPAPAPVEPPPAVEAAPAPGAAPAAAVVEPKLTVKAVGQEPGWTLEITEAGDTASLAYVGDYGKTTITLTGATKTVEGTKTTWIARDVDHQLIVAVDTTACADAMSGAAFPLSVSVDADGKRVAGCGGPPDFKPTP